MKKLLYLSDLYNYYVTQNKNVRFSSKDDDTTIVVHIDEPFTFAENESDDLNLFAPIRLCHTKSNVNKSSISEKAMKNAMDTAYEMPVLAYIYPDPDNEEQLTFAGHEFYVDENNEVVYEEAPVGVISSKSKLELVYDKDADKTYLDGVAKIWRTYTKAAEILEREKKFWVSVELCVDDLSYSAKDKELVINAFRFSGVTILGKSRQDGSEIRPGMTGANITIEDFSEKNNSVFSQNEKVIGMLSVLNEKLDNLNINIFSKEGGTKPVRKEFEENSEVAEAEVKETPSAEVFDGEENTEEPDFYEEGGEEGGDGGDGGDPTPDPEPDPTPDSEPEPDPTPDPEPEPADDDDEDDDTPTNPGLIDDDEDDKKKRQYSIECTIEHDGVKKSFSTIRDQLVALTTLVNETYGEADNCFYDCDADPESKVVYMHDYWNDKHYRQSYSVKKDVYSLKGDRTAVYCIYVSDIEKKQLEDMRANYSSIEEKLAQYEAEPEKLAVLADECYSQIADTDAYKKLAERDTYFSMSVHEVRAELDKQLLEFAKGHKVEFAVKGDKKPVGMKVFKNPSEKKSKGTSRYGGIFSR